MKLNGYKTILGTLGFVVMQGVKTTYPEYAAIADTLTNTVFIPLGVWGIAHKIEKVKGVK